MDNFSKFIETTLQAEVKALSDCYTTGHIERHVGICGIWGFHKIIVYEIYCL